MGDAPDVITFMASKERKHWRVARSNPLGEINRLRPLIQFNAGSPRSVMNAIPTPTSFTLQIRCPGVEAFEVA